MKVFRAIARIRYKNNIFCVFINNALQKYFIKELEDGSIIYPTEEEYKELNYIFNNKENLALFKIGQNYKFDPKVISKNGKLIAIGTIVLFVGITAPLIATIDVEQGQEYEETVTDQKVVLEDALQKGGDEFHSLYGYEDNRLYRIHKAISAKSELKIVECQDFEEFASYIETKSKPTYNELRETLRNNKNVDEKYKNWLFEGIDNLEKSMPNVDLTVLNYNLNRLHLEVTTLEELNKDSEKEQLIGRFNEETGEAYFIDTEDEDSNKFIVFHEVLGHGISEASFERPVNDTIKFGEYIDYDIKISREKIVVSDSIFVMKILEEKSDEDKEPVEFSHYFYVGQGLEEGKADRIAVLAMGDPNIKGHPYIEQSEQLRIMYEAVGLNFEDYISKGGAEILSQKMQENDVGNSLVYIVSCDTYTTAMKNRELELLDDKDTFRSNIIAFFKDYADNKMKKGESREEIVSKFSKILANGGEYIHSTFNSEEIRYEDVENDLNEASKELEKD